MKSATLAATLLLTAALTACASPQPAPASALDTLRSTGNMIQLENALRTADPANTEFAFSTLMLELKMTADGAAPGRLADWLSQTPDLPDTIISAGYEGLSERAHLETRYADSAQAAAIALHHASEDRRTDLADQLALAQAASTVPVSRSIGASETVLETRTDLARLLRVPVGFDDCASAELIVDTGAEISVIRESLAQAFSMRPLEGSIRVGTPTDFVLGHLVVAEQISVGEMVFTDVVFLTLPDDMLTLADGAYIIDGILGLQVFRTAGRVGWNEGGTQFLLGTAVPALQADDAALFWHTDGVGLAISIQDQRAVGFFDSGASTTLFRSGVLDHLTPGQISALDVQSRVRRGLGGAEEVTTQTLAELEISLAGASFHFEPATILPPEEDIPAADIAAVGNDLIKQVAIFWLDLELMRYRVER